MAIKFRIKSVLQFWVLAAIVSLQPAPHLLAQAQQPAQLNFRFEHITIEDGLTQGMVNASY
ncbi:MAG: hypothetical protein ACE5IR_21660 [bacterium]